MIPDIDGGLTLIPRCPHHTATNLVISSAVSALFISIIFSTVTALIQSVYTVGQKTAPMFMHFGKIGIM